MNVGKTVKTKFFVYLNKILYRIVHSWEDALNRLNMWLKDANLKVKEL